jgi:cell division protein FtsB
MENYQSNPSARENEKGGDASHRSEAHSEKTLKQENEQLKAYIFQYEQQIKDLESELKNLQ